MSQKFINPRKRIHIVNAAVLIWFGLLSSCDPCHQLAEKICLCRDSEEERRLCVANLGLANDHKYVKNARDTEVCVKALNDCTCEKINDNQDEVCGMYRSSVK